MRPSTELLTSTEPRRVPRLRISCSAFPAISRSLPASPFISQRYAGLFAQDSWRARSDLTLNFGLRWDYIMPWWEKYNQLQTLVPGKQSVLYPGAPAGTAGCLGPRNSVHHFAIESRQFCSEDRPCIFAEV